jgi:hypothetical protein
VQSGVKLAALMQELGRPDFEALQERRIMGEACMTASMLRLNALTTPWKALVAATGQAQQRQTAS